MRVFVSSTYLDLKEYRREAANAILDSGMEPVLIENSDLKIGDNWSNAVASEIDSADIFLIILSFRIGDINKIDKKSWIEKEYEIARKKSKPILTFMLSDDVPIIPSNLDSDFDKIQAFRNTIKTEFLVQFFSSPHDLYQRILLSLLKIRDRDKVNSSIELKNQSKVENYIEFKNVRILKLLLSSPGDVSLERELVAKAVNKFNQDYLIDKGVFIKLIRWEDFAPQIGNGTQKMVNRQLDAFDIFIGLMWNRFGTPTDLASSGTEEEFNDALNSWNKFNRPWIAFYFCTRPATLDTKEQLDQKGKVIDFKQKLMNLGLVKTFENLELFENMVFLDLIKITDEYLKKNYGS
jgi:hypothetical protein